MAYPNLTVHGQAEPMVVRRGEAEYGFACILEHLHPEVKTKVGWAVQC